MRPPFDEPLPVNQLIAEFGGNQWWYAYVEDCFDPWRYLVAGDSFEDAYSNLLSCERIVHQLDVRTAWSAEEAAQAVLKIEKGDDVSGTSFNDDGVLLDIESVQLSGPVRVVRIDVP